MTPLEVRPTTSPDRVVTLTGLRDPSALMEIPSVSGAENISNQSLRAPAIAFDNVFSEARCPLTSGELTATLSPGLLLDGICHRC